MRPPVVVGATVAACALWTCRELLEAVEQLRDDAT